MDSNKKINIFTILELLMPLFVFATMVMTEFVTVGADIGFGIKDITRLVITTVCLICVYLPLKDAFVSIFNEQKVTLERKDKYGEEVGRVHSNKEVAELAKFCKEEFLGRKRRCVSMILENTPYDYDTFKEKYEFDRKLIEADTSLEKTPAVKRAMLRAVREERRIKAETIDTVLPCGSHKGEYKRIKSDSKRTNTFVTTKKMVTVIASSFMLVSITVGLSPAASVVAIVTRVMISLTLIVMNNISALFAARAINKTYTEELYEKTVFLNEFHKWLESQPKQQETTLQ